VLWRNTLFHPAQSRNGPGAKPLHRLIQRTHSWPASNRPPEAIGCRPQAPASAWCNDSAATATADVNRLQPIDRRSPSRRFGTADSPLPSAPAPCELPSAVCSIVKAARQKDHLLPGNDCSARAQALEWSRCLCRLPPKSTILFRSRSESRRAPQDRSTWPGSPFLRVRTQRI